jgi:hypothetical protein
VPTARYGSTSAVCVFLVQFSFLAFKFAQLEEMSFLSSRAAARATALVFKCQVSVAHTLLPGCNLNR